MFRKCVKWLGLSLLMLVTLTAGFIAHEWYADKPLRFKSYLDRNMVQLAFDSPEMLTTLGFLESLGITGHNAQLDDASLAKFEELYDLVAQVRTGIAQYSDEELDKNDKLSKDIAMYLLDFAVEAGQYRYYNYPVNQLFGLQNEFPSFMDAQHQVHNMQDAEYYISRLSQIKRKFSQSLEGLRWREKKQIIPPLFVIDRVLEEMQQFVDQPIQDNILYTSLQQKMIKAQTAARKQGETAFTASQQQQILMAVEEQMDTAVYPAYQLLIDYFTELRSQATTDDGIWKLPDGDNAYASMLKFFTTTDYSAEYIHEIGLSEVERIQTEILAILDAQGYATGAGFTAAIQDLAADSRFYYPDTDAGRAQILQDYQQLVDEISLGIDEAFNVRPEADMAVRRIPEFKEKTAPGAYYQQPAIDGSRSGLFFVNLYDIKATPKYSMRTLAYHEGIPGHHFQIAIAMETQGLPLFRKASPFIAYVEGWALYAEQLAWELGFQEDPFDNIGRLQAELFRAVRLVVDTGIHHKRWTRDYAIEYMLNNTGMAQSDVISEIERYIVMPGQATAYKIGMMKILEIRESAKKQLGDQFDLAEFHDVVLKNGAVPLDILADIVDDYVAAKR